MPIKKSWQETCEWALQMESGCKNICTPYECPLCNQADRWSTLGKSLYLATLVLIQRLKKKVAIIAKVEIIQGFNKINFHMIKREHTWEVWG
jgi:hypothetical protein